MKTSLPSLLSCMALTLATSLPVHAEDWPMYRHDLRRSAVSQDNLDPSLTLHWVFKPLHRPRPAWPLPPEETPRMHSDRAYHVVSAGDLAYFGSSTDHQIYALDVATGEVRWTFYSEGPIRFAPVISGAHLFFGSDDGLIYSLEAATGRLLWKHRPSPSSEHVLGNGRMISLWPVRTGLLVEDGVVYSAAGVFPYEGLYISAVDAKSGTEIWNNDTVGDQAWGLEYGGLAPQGYLLASDKVLYVPAGRAMPAAFDRATGQFIRFLAAGGKAGGTWALVEDGQLIAGVNDQGTPTKVAYDEATGKRKGDIFATIDGVDLVQTPQTSFTLADEGIYAVNRESYRQATQELSDLNAARGKLRTRSSDLSKELRTLRTQISELEKQNQATTPTELAEAKAKRNEFLGSIDEVGAQIADLNQKENKLERSHVRWTYPATNLTCLVLAGNVVVAGGNGRVITLDATDGKLVAQNPIQGEVLGLAVANGRVFVSTDQGPIYSFGKPTSTEPRRHRQTTAAAPFPSDTLDAAYRTAAEAILKQTPTRKGYCLVMNAGEGRLALEIARGSEFQVIALQPDPAKRQTARDQLNAAGLYGERVMVEPWDLSELPDYFANLIVSDTVVSNGELTGSAKEMFRVLRPYGGVAIFGQPSGTPARSNFDPRGWLAASGAPELERVSEGGDWWKLTRGPLEGAGSWTGLYGNPANTGSSDDDLVRGPLGVLWFGEPGSEHMPDRHARSVSPLAVNGRLYIQGSEVLMGYDGYNGTQLWERHIPGAIRVRVDVDGSNLSAADEALYVAAFDKTYKLDGQTGRTLEQYDTPSSTDGDPRRWGYVAVTDGMVYGSGAMPLEHEYGYVWNTLIDGTQWKQERDVPEELQETLKYLKANYPGPDEKARAYFRRSTLLWRFMAQFPGWAPDHTPSPTDATMMISDSVFAYDDKTGKMLWEHTGRNIPNITITVGDKTMFFVEDEPSETVKQAALEQRKELIKDGRYIPHEEETLPYEKKDIRRVVAIDARTGKVAWSKAVDLSGCGGTKLGTAYQDGKLLCFGHYSNHDQTVFAKGGLEWRRISVFDAKTGDLVWSKPLNYRRRPLIVGDTIYIEPRACYLATGEIKMREHPITGEAVPWEFLRPGHSCGIVTASPHSIFYRSFCAAIVDVEKDSGMSLFGAVRPGCWNNLIPGNGLLNFQEASAGCTCSYGLRTTVVLNHKKQKDPGEWSVFITQGNMTPVSHLALNFGAPGDMRDEAGTLWFGYPRPSTSVGQGPYKDYGVKFTLNETLLEGMGLFRKDFRAVEIDNSTRPWLFTSGIRGLTRCQIPLLDDQPPATYKVRMGFVAAQGEKAGQRVFHVKLQGQEVLKAFDPVWEAQRPNHALIREFEGIQVTKDLILELVPTKENPTEAEAPIMHFLEIIREDQPVRAASAEKP